MTDKTMECPSCPDFAFAEEVVVEIQGPGGARYYVRRRHYRCVGCGWLFATEVQRGFNNAHYRKRRR